jgi:hypothetical protein
MRRRAFLADEVGGPYLEDFTPVDAAGRLADVLGGFRPPSG